MQVDVRKQKNRSDPFKWNYICIFLFLTSFIRCPHPLPFSLCMTLILIYLLCVPTLWAWVSDFWVFSQNSVRVLFVWACGIRLSGVSASGVEAHVCVRRGSSVTLPHGTQTDTTLVLSWNRKWHGVSQNVPYSCWACFTSWRKWANGHTHMLARPRARPRVARISYCTAHDIRRDRLFLCLWQETAQMRMLTPDKGAARMQSCCTCIFVGDNEHMYSSGR